MADLLTHVLATYVLLTGASWVTDRVDSRWTAVGMAGAAIPDLVKGRLLAPGYVVERTLGVPFDYSAISTLGGVALVAGVITAAFGRRYWRRTYAFLLFGGLCSLVGDGLRAFADGHSTSWLYPLTWWRPPTPNLYVTADYRVTVVVVAVAAVVAAVDASVIERFQSGRTDRRDSE